MKRQRRKSTPYYVFYNELTEPMLPGITAPMPSSALPRESARRKLARSLRNFFSPIITAIRQFLALALAALLLLLLARFFFTFFKLSLGDFSYWIFFLSTPPITPFDKLLSPALSSLHYFSYYTIDVSTLVAIVTYTVGVALVRWMLKPFIRKRQWYL